MALFQDSTGQWYRGPDQDVAPARQDPALLSRGIVRTPTGEYLRVPATSLQYWQDEEPEPPQLAAQAPAPDPEEGVRFSDYAKSIMAGGAQIAEGVGWLTRMAGGEDIGRSIEELGSNAVDYWNSGLSDAAKDAISRDFVRKNEAGEWEWGDADLNTVGLFGAQSLLGTAAGMGAGAGITKVLQVFANPVGRAALTQAVTKGTTALPAAAQGNVAALAAVKTAGAAAKKLQVIDKLLGATGFGLGEGAIGGITAGVNVYQSVLSLSAEKLATNDRYQQVFNSTDEKMPYLERHQYAAETVAREASSLAGLQAGLTTALLGAPMGAFLGGLLGKKALGAMAQTTPRAITTGAVGEAAQEFAQGAAETLIANRQLAMAGEDIDLFEGVLNQAIGGAVAGAPLGGAFGALDVQGTPKRDGATTPKRDAGKPQPRLDPLRTVAMEAAKAGVPQEEILATVEAVKRGEKSVLVAVGELRKRQIGAAAAQPAGETKVPASETSAPADGTIATEPETPAAIPGDKPEVAPATAEAITLAQAEPPLGIPRDEKLSKADQKIEQRFIKKIEADPAAVEAEYAQIKGTLGGKLLNTDMARELSPDYLKDRKKSAAVHEPASWVVKQLYARKLAEQPETGDLPEVLFTAGGTGAGKTAGLAAAAAKNPDVDRAQVIYDTNMNGAKSSIQKIEQALEAGKSVRIVYTYRDPVDALVNGALRRAGTQAKKFGTGRAVPLDAHADTHVGSRDAMDELRQRYRKDQRVKMLFIDNSRGKGQERVVGLDELPRLEYDSTLRGLHEALDREYAEGRITEDVYRAFKGDADGPDLGAKEGLQDEDDRLRDRAGDAGEVLQSGLGEGRGREPAAVVATDADAATQDDAGGLRGAEALQAASSGSPAAAQDFLSSRAAAERIEAEFAGPEEAVTPTPAPPQPERTRVAAAPPAAPAAIGQPSVNDRLAQLLERAIRRDAMEAQGRAILDEMDDAGETPRAVATEFWDQTYPKLNDKTRRLFERQAKAMGFEPGDVLLVEKDGTQVTARDWPDVGRFLAEEMPKRGDELEGGERGFVSLMKWANEQAARFSDQAGDTSLPLLSRGAAPSGQLASAVRAKLAAAIAEVSPLVNVVIAESPTEYELSAGDPLKTFSIEGAFIPGTGVVLFASNLPPGRELEVFAHEVFGHLAMERHPAGREAVEMTLSLHDRGHESIEKLWREVAVRQGHLDRITHAKEVVALMAERGDKHAVMTRLIAGVRRFLRKLGIVRDYSDAEVRGLIARAARALRVDVNQALAGKSPLLAALNPASRDADILAALDEAIPPDVVAIDKHLQPALFSRAAVADPSIRAIMDRVLAKAPEEFTLKDKARKLWSDLTNTDALAVKQGLIDTFASFEAMERDFTGGQLLDASQSAHKAALATKNLPSVMAAVMMAGVPDYVNGAYVPVAGRKGVLDIFKPLTEHKEGNLLRQWELFAAANRANRLINERNPDGTRRENLFTQAEINTALTLEQKYPEFRTVLIEWNAFNKQMLDLAQDAGVIDPVSRAVWEKNDYVPFYRAVEDFQGPRKKKGVAGQRAQIKILKGRDEALGNVFENMMLNTAHLLDASFKNRAMQRVVGLGIGTALQPVPFEAEAIKVTDEQLARALDKAGVTVNGLSVVQSMTPQQKAHWSTIFRRVAPAGPDIVSVMVNGKPEYYQVTDPLVLSSLTAMGHDNFADIWGLFRGSKKLLTSAITADPAFMLANFARDTLSNWVVSDASMHPFIDAIKGIKAGLATDPALLQMMMAGAGGGGYYDSNPEDIRKLISTKVPHTASKGITDAVIDTPHKAWQAWRKIGSAAENANRIAVFRAVLAKGGTVAEAAYQARDVLNFSMSGDYAAMRWLTQTVPFLNARVQGLYRLYRGARDNKRAFFIKGSMLLAATMALALRNNDREEYEEISEWDKDLYWHFFVGGEHYRLPKPFEVGAMFATIPERIWRTASGRDSPKILMQRVGQMAMDTFAFNPVPQLVKPVIEQYANRSMFTGSPIVGMAEMRLQPEAQFTPWTSETMREMADAMPDFAPEWLRSPRRLEAALRAYTGSMGMYVLGVSDSLVRNALGYPEEPGRKIYDFPVVKRFLVDPQPRHTKYADQMYEMLDEANAVYSTINRFRREQRFEEALAMQKENKSKLAVRVRLNRVATNVRNINAQIRLMQHSRTLTAKEKRERIDVLVERKNKLTRQVAPWADLF